MKDCAHALNNLPGWDDYKSAAVLSLQLSANFTREVLQGVRPGENEINDRRSDAQIRAPCGVEERLQFVSQATQRIQVQKPRATLERVKCTEDGVDRP